MDAIIIKAKIPDEALRMLEDHFLDDRAKCVNYDVLLKQSFALIKLKRSARNEDVTDEKVWSASALKYLSLLISEPYQDIPPRS